MTVRLPSKTMLWATTLLGALMFVSHSGHAGEAPRRLNPFIEKVQAGSGPVLTDQDWAFLDYEHGNGFNVEKLRQDLAQLGTRRKANGQLPMAPLVRLPVDGDEDSRWMVKQVLDSGALGVIFPRIQSRAEAERAIANMRYPTQKGQIARKPEGKRGFGPTLAVQYWGLPTAIDYVKRADVWPLNPDGELVAVLMIESAEGVQHVDEIVSTPGVGAILIGPGDLGMSLGVWPLYPNNAPETEAAMQTVVSACKKYNVVCITQAGAPDEIKRRVVQGFRGFIVSAATYGQK
jgi:4-hydroxy-2-oxoheptanedioate aldolase